MLPVVCVLLVRLERRVHALELVGRQLEIDVALLRQATKRDRELFAAALDSHPHGQ